MKTEHKTFGELKDVTKVENGKTVTTRERVEITEGVLGEGFDTPVCERLEDIMYFFESGCNQIGSLVMPESEVSGFLLQAINGGIDLAIRNKIKASLRSSSEKIAEKIAEAVQQHGKAFWTKVTEIMAGTEYQTLYAQDPKTASEFLKAQAGLL